MKDAANPLIALRYSYFLNLIIPKAQTIGINTYSLLDHCQKGVLF